MRTEASAFVRADLPKVIAIGPDDKNACRTVREVEGLLARDPADIDAGRGISEKYRSVAGDGGSPMNLHPLLSAFQL